MKRIFSLVLIALVGVAVLTSFTPKKKKKKSKSFKGTITFDLSYESSELTQLQISKMPKTVKVKVYKDMSRVEIVSGPMVQTIISRPKDSVQIFLFEVMDKKAGITVRDTVPDNDSTEQYTVSIEYSGDTKVIAGYTCKKAVVTFTPKEGVEAEEQTFAVFYSEELGDATNNEDSEYKGIPGLLLEFYQVTPKITTKYVAKEIKKGGVNELDFFFPSDYKEFKNQEDLVKFFQGE